MVNPRAFVASMSALRALEATIICLEMRDIPYVYIDSKEWQRFFFASSLIGHGDMKEASRTIGVAMFGNHATAINKHKDADGLLIAEYAKRNYDKLKFPKDV
jgi:hypothetical protein